MLTYLRGQANSLTATPERSLLTLGRDRARTATELGGCLSKYPSKAGLHGLRVWFADQNNLSGCEEAR